MTYRPPGLLCTPARDTESGQSLNAFTRRTQNHNFLLQTVSSYSLQLHQF